jgi:hypothetical protein
LEIKSRKLLDKKELKNLRGGVKDNLCCYFYSDYYQTLIYCGATPSCTLCGSVEPPGTVFTTCNTCDA